MAVDRRLKSRGQSARELEAQAHVVVDVQGLALEFEEDLESGLESIIEVFGSFEPRRERSPGVLDVALFTYLQGEHGEGTWRQRGIARDALSLLAREVTSEENPRFFLGHGRDSR
jgi:hypothetical protein